MVNRMTMTIALGLIERGQRELQRKLSDSRERRTEQVKQRCGQERKRCQRPGERDRGGRKAERRIRGRLGGGRVTLRGGKGWRKEAGRTERDRGQAKPKAPMRSRRGWQSPQLRYPALPQHQEDAIPRDIASAHPTTYWHSCGTQIQTFRYPCCIGLYRIFI